MTRSISDSGILVGLFVVCIGGFVGAVAAGASIDPSGFKFALGFGSMFCGVVATFWMMAHAIASQRGKRLLWFFAFVGGSIATAILYFLLVFRPRDPSRIGYEKGRS